MIYLGQRTSEVMDPFIQMNQRNRGFSLGNELLLILPELIHLHPDSYIQINDATPTTAEETRSKRQTSAIFAEIWSESGDFWELLRVYNEINDSEI